MSLCLVTGGAGFIGSHIVEFLLYNSYDVIVVDNLSTGRIENIKDLIGKRCKFIRANIANKSQLAGIMKNVRIVFHQAAIPSVAKSVKNPLATYKANVIGTLNVLHEAKKANVEKVIYASSSSIYGPNSKLPVEEDLIPNPISPYAASKLAGEHICRVYKLIHGLNVVCLRYFNVFGPRQNPFSQYAAVIPKFITRILQNKSPVIYGDGKQSRDFTYVYNVVKANMLAAKIDTGNELVFNIASSKPVSINELVDKINSFLGTDIKPIYTKERLGDIKHSYASIKKAQKILAYNIEVPFESGLEQTIKYYQKCNAVR
jgi:UDP-glucose 4-epimerase